MIEVTMRALQVPLAFLAAVIVTAALGAAAATQFVLAALAELGAQVPFDMRVTMTLHDIAGMGPFYAAIVAVGFLIALSVAALLMRFLPHPWRSFIYAAAGGLAILSAILIMRALLGITPIAGARSTAGLAVQALVGAAGGYLFARLTRPVSRQAG